MPADQDGAQAAGSAAARPPGADAGADGAGPPARLAALDSCAVSDALDRLGLPGAVAGLLPVTFGKRIAGRIVTVELGPAGPGVPARHLGAAAIDAASPGDVIVVAAGGRTDAAGWGGVLAAAAAARQVSGVVVDGACRDVDEIRALRFPVYARAAVARTARGRLAEVAWGGPVLIGGVAAETGDYLLADGSGLVVIQAGRLAEVVSAAEQITAREAAMLRRIQAGEPVSEVLSADYENLLTGPPGPPAG